MKKLNCIVTSAMCAWAYFSGGVCALHAQGPGSALIVCMYMHMHTSTCVHNDKALVMSLLEGKYIYCLKR